MSDSIGSDQLLKSQIKEFEEWNENVSGLQIENESLKHQIKHLEITVSSYEYETAKYEGEKDEMIKSINYFREQSEETASSVFLKSDNLSNLKQEIIRLIEDNEHYKHNIIKINTKLKGLQIENNELREQNIKYEKSLSESRLNEDLLTKSYSQQTSEYVIIRAILNEYQTKYDKLYLENCVVQEKISKLNDDMEEINMIKTTNGTNNNEGEDEKDDDIKEIPQRYSRTLVQSKMSECMNSFYHKECMMTPSSTRQSVNITPKRALVYNFDNIDYNISSNIAPKAPYPPTIPPLDIVSCNFDMNESPVSTTGTIKENDTTSQDEEYDNINDIQIYYQSMMEKLRAEMLAEQELMETEWRKKFKDLKAENQRLRRFNANKGLLIQCGDSNDIQRMKNKRNGKKKKRKSSKIASLEKKAKMLHLKQRGKCDNYWGIPCITNKYLKR